MTLVAFRAICVRVVVSSGVRVSPRLSGSVCICVFVSVFLSHGPFSLWLAGWPNVCLSVSVSVSVSAPQLRAQLVQLQTTLSLQMNKPAFLLKALDSALRQKATQKKRVTTIQRHFHKQLLESLTTSPVDRAVLLSQSTSHTGAQRMQPSSEAYEAEDRCFRAAVARRLLLPRPAAANSAGVVRTCPNKSAASPICTKLADVQQHHCCGCRYGGGVAGVPRWPGAQQTRHAHTVGSSSSHPHREGAAGARAKRPCFESQRSPPRTWDVAIVAPLSSNLALVAAASTRPGHMAKRAQSTHQPCPFHPGDYRRGNPQSCWCRPLRRNWSFSLTASPCSLHGQIWSIQT